MSDRRHQVFVSSTFSDLQDEREAVWRALVASSFVIVGMEAFPATTSSQLDYIKRQIVSSDYFVLITAGRYGSLDSEGISYTEREFEIADSIGLPIIFFRHSDLDNLISKKRDTDPSLRERLASFNERVGKTRIFAGWESADQLALLVLQGVQNAVIEHPRPGWVRGDLALGERGVAELEALRRENSELKVQLKKTTEFDGDSLVSQRVVSRFKIEYIPVKEPNVAKSAQISLADILCEMSLTEEPSYELIDEAARGAISRRTEDNYEDIALDWATTDSVILKLVENRILRLVSGGAKVKPLFGPQWVSAHSLAKLGKKQSG